MQNYFIVEDQVKTVCFKTTNLYAQKCVYKDIVIFQQLCKHNYVLLEFHVTGCTVFVTEFREDLHLSLFSSVLSKQATFI